MKRNRFFRGLCLILACMVVGCCLFTGCFESEEEETTTLDWDALDTPLSYYEALKGQKITLNVYNWGEYISNGADGSMDVNAEFEALTGIQVNYTNYPSNEDLYAKLKSGATNYDIIIPSDYMISRLIAEDMLEKIDLSNIPNYRFIMDTMKNQAHDPENEYSVPYTWGTVGIIYNTKYVDAEDVKSWNVLWNEKYAQKILMFRNSRDAFCIAERLLGYSFNSTNEEEYIRCSEKLKEQKKVVKIYVMDEVFDKMIGEEAWLAPYYAGDAISMMEDNPNLDFAIPAEGTNLFFDSICIPKGSQNHQAAEMYINFLNETQVALANIEYICYSTPHQGAYDALDEETKENPVHYPTEEQIRNTEVYANLPPEINQLLDNLWEEILMTQDEDRTRWVFPTIIGLAFLGTVILTVVRTIRKNRNSEE